MLHDLSRSIYPERSLLSWTVLPCLCGRYVSIQSHPKVTWHYRFRPWLAAACETSTRRQSQSKATSWRSGTLQCIHPGSPTTRLLHRPGNYLSDL